MSDNLIISNIADIKDLSFKDYTKRQLHEISAKRNGERALKVTPANNFYFSNNAWSPLEYEGFAVVSMLNENEANEPLLTRLIQLQQELHVNLPPAYAFYQLPPESFHQTVANTLSADRFKKHILNEGLENVYPEIVARAFDNLPYNEDSLPLNMQMAGLSIFGTAIGMLGVFNSEEDYNRVVHFRKGFYSNYELSQLDVRMTRPFIGHITIAYIEHNLNKNQKEHLAAVIKEMNDGLSYEDLYFNIANTGLRRYHHLAEFIKQDNFPTYKL